MLEKALAHAGRNQQAYLSQLQAYLRIPSISTLPEHRSDVARAAEWVAADMQRLGLRNVRVMPSGGYPFVYGEWLEAPNAPTLLIYGHYDVQPVDPLDAWQHDPFGAEIQGGKIWARGASDNKGQHFAHLKAIESCLAATGRLPLNVKVLLEGEEESLSQNLEPFLRANQRLLAADTGVISDGAMIRPGTPEIDYGLRGVVALEIRVRGPGRDLHSGSYGGTVLNPVQALAAMLASLHHENGAVTIPGFYDRVRPLTPEERALLNRAGYTLEQWQRETGACLPWGEPEFTLLERIGARPTCEINGIWGGFSEDGMKTIIPASAGAKITLRIVPDQDPDEIARLFQEHLQSIAPPQIQMDIRYQSGCWPVVMPLDAPEIRAAARACRQTWGVEPVFSRGGGSLPVVAAFQQILGAPFALIPFGLDDNRHSPNEHLGLEYFFNGIQTAIRYYYSLSSEFELGD